ncbi:cysteine protease [Thermococcus sp. MAR1]|uniref:cysteine protease n=1 Tax=Thermococcus sp. MAR1 TaxID=1638263 RepID=UPI00143A3A04|nr:cysteine protease [Thermococcus sp. MAR1]NJE10607.1 cysteine protease [Thermococcus sp. MAR1]
MNPRVAGSVILALLLVVSMVGYTGAFGKGGEGKLEYKVYSKEQVMSAVYKAYGNPELGFWVAKVVIRNTGDGALKNIKIRYSIDNYAPETARSYPVLVPGGTIVDLYYPILSSEVTKLTMPTPSNLRITVEYEANGERKTEEITRPIQILGIHDFVFSSLPPEESTGSFYDTFSNAPLIAAWVTTTDPVVREFADMGNRLAGGAGASLSDDEAIKSLSGIWALALMNGFSYKTEPNSYWTAKAAQHVMYPRDVIRDKSGTCLDLAIWFATLATTQGLKSYVVFIPGHAFPLIELPSGALIPVEATVINEGVSFQEAIQAGIQTWQEAMQGPYIIVDVAEMQSNGIVPPELPELPADVLTRWGISLQTGGTGGGVGGTSGGNEGNGGGAGETGGGTGNTGEWNTYHGNYFSFDYPASWDAPEDYGGYVYLLSPDTEFEFIVLYSQGASVEDMVRAFEDSVADAEMTIKERQETQASIAGITAYTVLYTIDTGYGDYSAVARYFTAGGVGFAVVYDFPAGKNEYNQLGEYMVSTFKLG